MKKFLILLTVILSMFTYNLDAQAVKINWQASPDTNVVGYKIYYRATGTSNYQTINVVGRLVTNALIAVPKDTLFESYITANNGAGLESDPSNKAKFATMYTSGYGTPTPLVLLDNVATNLPTFVLSSVPSYGSLSGNPPNVTYNPTNTGYVKDVFAYRSPEMFSSLNVTNYYLTYKVTNGPPVILSITPN